MSLLRTQRIYHIRKGVFERSQRADWWAWASSRTGELTSGAMRTPRTGSQAGPGGSRRCPARALLLSLHASSHLGDELERALRTRAGICRTDSCMRGACACRRLARTGAHMWVSLLSGQTRDNENGGSPLSRRACWLPASPSSPWLWPSSPRPPDRVRERVVGQ